MLFIYYSLILLVLYYFSMSSYGRYRNSASSYQFRARPGYASGSFAPKGARKYTRAAPAGRTNARNNKYISRPKFATVAFTRDIEKKYFDRTITSNINRAVTTGISSTPNEDQGYMWSSWQWQGYDFSGASPITVNTTNDLMRGVPQDASVNGRIGNKINVKYSKGAITFSAAKLIGPVATVQDMDGEVVATSAGAATATQFLRTTFRFCIVKDLQVNSANAQIEWNEVFETTAGKADGDTGGVHSELNIANMGRFRVIHDQYFDLTADNPQKTIPYQIGGNKIGSIRYAGPSPGAGTSTGVYIIWSAYVSNTLVGASLTDGLTAPRVQLHNRLCYTDS